MVPTAVRLSLSAALVALLHEVILPTCTPEQASFDAAIRLFGADPARAFVLTIVCIHAAIFLGMNLLLTGLDASGLLAEWRLQPGRWPPAELMWRAARLIALNQLLVQPLQPILGRLNVGKRDSRLLRRLDGRYAPTLGDWTQLRSRQHRPRI